MKTLVSLLFAMLIPTGAIAEKPKEVIITDSVPIIVEVMSDNPVKVELEPGGIVHTTPVPIVAAKVKGFNEFFSEKTDGDAQVTVGRGSILKYVNLSFPKLVTQYNRHLINFGSPYNCRVDINLIDPETGETLLLASVAISGGHSAGSGSRELVLPSPLQFATGDILVPAGHIIMAEVSDSSYCEGWLYGLLYEQD